MNIKDLELIKEFFQFYRIPDLERCINQFTIYHDVLFEGNKRINLISKDDENKFTVRHLLDSLLLCSVLNMSDFSGKQVLDVGSGAGLPGIPLKIVWENIKLMMIDSQRKRTAFLKKVSRALAYDDIEILHNRIEDSSIQLEYQNRFDLIVSRAVENFPLIYKKCLPLLKKGGILVFYKGYQIENEINILNQGLIEASFRIEIRIPDKTLDLIPYKRKFIVIFSD